MSIKQIIDAERWSLVLQHFDYTAEQHNASLDRIEDAVAEHTKRLDSVFAQVEQSFIDRIIRLEECLRMCVPYLPEATATKDEVTEVLGGDA